MRIEWCAWACGGKVMGRKWRAVEARYHTRNSMRTHAHHTKQCALEVDATGKDASMSAEKPDILS